MTLPIGCRLALGQIRWRSAGRSTVPSKPRGAIFSRGAGTRSTAPVARRSLPQIRPEGRGRFSWRGVLLAARDAGCSSVPIVVDASGPTVRWRRLGPDENLSTWRAAGPFNSAEGLEVVLERVAPWCR